MPQDRAQVAGFRPGERRGGLPKVAKSGAQGGAENEKAPSGGGRGEDIN